MYKLRAFVTIPSLINNALGVVSPIGELSPTSETYSRERGSYTRPDYPDVRLVSFRSQLDDALIVVPTAHVTTSLALSQWLFTRAIGGSISEDKTSTLVAMRAFFGSTVENLEMGDTVTNGSYWFPQWISYSVLGQSQNECRLWYNNEAFSLQYDYSDIVIVSGVLPVDEFHLGKPNVDAKLDAYLMSEHTGRAQIAMQGHPTTFYKSYEYDWVNPANTTQKRTTNWIVLVYGIAGNNEDLIKATLRDYLLANSSYTVEQWEVIFPEIFIPTEFYVTPFWNRYSLPELTLQQGIYSSSIPLAELPTYRATFKGYTPDHIALNEVVVSTAWKGLSFLSVGNARNLNGKYRFNEMWPQFVNIPMGDLDYNRISPKTRDFMYKLTQTFLEAEKGTSYIDLTEGFTRVNREGVEYIALSYDRVQYLVPLKSTFA